MPLPDLLTSLQSTNTASSKEAVKSASLDESQMTDAAAQFSGAFTQALQQQQQPTKEGEALPASGEEMLKASETLAEGVIPEEEPTPVSNAPAFPLNIISALQALLNPKAAVNPSTEETGAPASTVSAESLPTQQIDVMASDVATAVSAPPPASETATPVTAAESNPKVETIQKNQLPDTMNTLTAVETKAGTSESTEASSSAANASSPSDITNTKKDTKNSIAKTDKKEVSTSDVPTAVPVPHSMTIESKPVAMPSALPIEAMPVHPIISQPAPIQPTAMPTPTIGNDAKIAEPVALPVTHQTPSALPQNPGQPTFSENLATALPANTTPQPVQVDAQTNTADTGNLPLSEATQTTEAIQSAPAFSELATPVIASDSLLSRESNKLVAPKVENATSKKSAPVSTDLNKLQAISDQLQSLNGQVESHATLLKSTQETDLSEPQDNTFTLPVNTADITTPLQHTGSTDLFNAPSVSSDSKIPSFISQAAHPADQVIEGASFGVKNGHQELVIRLNPDNLGEVRINLTTSGKDAVSARLIASSPESHEILQSQISHLKTSLEAQGIQLDRLSVVIAGNTESSSSSQSGQQHQQSNFQQSDNKSQSNTNSNFNQQQGQPNPQLAFQMGQQGNSPYKSNYAQAPNYSATQIISDPISETVSSGPTQNTDGSISVLA